MKNKFLLVFGLFISISLILFASADWVYQETYNQTSSAGTGWDDINLAIDGNWTNMAICTQGAQCYLYLNYTKQADSTSAIWQTRDNEMPLNTDRRNITIPTSCWDYNETKLILQIAQPVGSGTSQLIYYCYNSSGWGIINKSIAQEGDGSLYEEAIWWNTTTTADTTPPTITFNYQILADLNLSNFLGTDGVNISYNISDTSGINWTTLYYKANSTTSNVMYYQNGTSHSGYFSHAILVNDSISYIWKLLDNEVLPATYNYGEVTLESTAHSTLTLIGTPNAVKVQLLNVSNTTQYSFFEIMANKTVGTGAGASVYYCNSSYSSGSVSTNTNCILFYTQPATTGYTHNHTGYSSHQVIPMAINITSGTIGSIKVTSTSYFVFRGSTGVGNWDIGYITNSSRTGAIQTTGNAGTSWTSQTYTIDAHLHQFSGADSLWYYACANDTLGNANCSSPRQDLFELGGLSPTVIISSPIEQIYNNNMSINYTALSPNAYSIINYTIDLLNSTYDFNKTIVANTTNISYIWNTLGYDGEWIIRIQAEDSIHQLGYGYSPNFTIDNTPPNVFLIHPVDYANLTTHSNWFAANASDPFGLYEYTLSITNSTPTGVFAVIDNFAAGTFNAIINESSTSLPDDTYTWAYQVCDYANNCNATANWHFRIDTTAPTLNIVHPQAISYSTTTLDLNYTISDSGVGLSSCWYRNDTDAINITIACGTNTTISHVEGTHTIYMWANDTLNNIVSDSVTYQISTTAPAIVLNAPPNNEWLNYKTNIYFNFTATDSDGLDTCELWGNWTGSWAKNYTWIAPNSGIQNFTIINLTDGKYSWNVWCNDTVGNAGWAISNYTLNVDTTPPYFTTIPANTSINYTQGFGVDFDAADDFSGFGYYSINWTTLFTINQSGWLTNSTPNIAAGLYYINVSVNDSLNNINSTIYLVNISKATSINCGLFVFPGMAVTYPTTTQYRTINPGDIGDSDITLHLYRDGVEVSNPENIILGVGTYAYLANMTGGQNWTDKALCGSSNLVVSQGSQSVTPLLNGANANLVIAYPQQFNASYTGTNRTTLTIKANVTLLTISQNYTYGTGSWVINYSMPSNQNYTGFETYLNLTITKTASSVYAYINHTRNNFSADDRELNTYLNGTRIVGEGIIKLWLNNSLINQGASPLFNITNLTLGAYYFNVTYDETENYTASSESFLINITHYEAPVSGTSGESPGFVIEKNTTITKGTPLTENIEKSFKSFFEYFAYKLYPTNQAMGKLLLMVIIFTLIFLIIYLKNNKGKVIVRRSKWQET